MEESISNNRIKSSPSILSEISVQSSVSHFTLCPKLPRCTLLEFKQFSEQNQRAPVWFNFETSHWEKSHEQR